MPRKSLTEQHKMAISEAMKKRKIGPSQNAIVANQERLAKKWTITFPDGEKVKITNLRAFCREHKLQTENMWKVSQGKISHCKGFKCEAL